MSKYQRHIFVCNAERPPMGKPSCGARGGEAILVRLREGLAEHPEAWDSVTVTGCACLGLCFDGPTAVVYPEATWYVNLRPEDAGEILTEHLLAGRPVARSRYEWPE